MGTLGTWLIVMERLHKTLRSGTKADWREFSILCTSLSKLIDIAVVKNQTLPILQDLSPLLKKVCERKDDLRFQPAIMVLLLSVKNALHLGWFTDAETQEILLLAQELLGHFMGNGGLAVVDTADAGQLISKIIPRFYPRLKLQKVIFAIEIKQGYETTVYDFNLKNKPSVYEQLRLFVIRNDNIDTSACLISPPHVNFLVNGKGVERRCIVYMDTGPQLPTDITGMLKVGINMMQVVGDFPGPFTVALALTGTVTDLGSPLCLHPYHAGARESLSDDDLIEGPSRISLRCPISHKRIATPVKGAHCKHHQCFDYDSFMEINCRRPAWRCPCCNRHVSFPDLRLDLQMIKVLREVEELVFDVMISDDGSWVAFLPKDDTSGSLSQRKVNAASLRRESSPEDGEIVPDQHVSILVDLSDEDEIDRETDGQSNRAFNSSFDLRRSASTFDGRNSETEDIKPDIRTINMSATSDHLTNGEINSLVASRPISIIQDSGRGFEAFETVHTTSPLVPILTDSVVSVERIGSLEGIRDHITSATIDPFGQLTSFSPGNSDGTTFQLAQAIRPEGSGTGLVVSSEGFPERQLNRELSRTPIAIQALPAQTHLLNPNTRSRISSTSHPNSPAQPMIGAHSSISPFYIGSQRSQISASSVMAAPTLAADMGSGAAQESQPQFFFTSQHQNLQDSQSQLQSQVQPQFAEERQRLMHQSQPLRTTQSMQFGQRPFPEQHNLSTTRNNHQTRFDHQGMHQQPTPYQQPTRHLMQSISDAALWQQVRLSAVQLQQIQQAYLNLGANQNVATREENFSGQGGGLVTGIVEGMPQMNQAPNVSVGIGSGRRQPVQGIRSVTSQILQRNNSLVIPNTTALYLGENRWVNSSHAPAQLVDGAAVHTLEQRNRPVARMRGSITATGRVATTSPLNQVSPGNYAWLYGLSTQPTATVSPSAGINNPSSRLSPPFTSSWIGEQGRHWGQLGGAGLHNIGVSTGLGSSLQTSQTTGLDLNWIESQLELPLSLPNQPQGTSSMNGISGFSSNPFGVTRLDPF